MPISGELTEDFDEAINKLSESIKKELAGFDYYVIYSISKQNKNGDLENLANHVSSLTGATPFAVMKIHVGNIVSKVQQLLFEYQLVPSQPLLAQKEERK
jgi:hypothetical protein